MTQVAEEFRAIAAYEEADLQTRLADLQREPEFVSAMASLSSAFVPRGFRWITSLIPTTIKKSQALRLLRKICGDISTFQERDVLLDRQYDRFFGHALRRVSTNLKERPRSGFYVSNHRDIAMDAVVVRHAMRKVSGETLWHLVGDNLEDRRWREISHRLLGSMQFKRPTSVASRLAYAKELDRLARYIAWFIGQDRRIWCAQGNGRSVLGKDRTSTGLFGMLALAGQKSGRIRSLATTIPIYPVSISYERDPMDVKRAMFEYRALVRGSRDKVDDADYVETLRGLMGDRGRVHAEFGPRLETCDSVDEYAAQADAFICGHYKLWPTNIVAAELMLEMDGSLPHIDPQQVAGASVALDERRRVQEWLARRCSRVSDAIRELVIRSYAEPVFSKAEFSAEKNSST